MGASLEVTKSRYHYIKVGIQLADHKQAFPQQVDSTFPLPSEVEVHLFRLQEALFMSGETTREHYTVQPAPGIDNPKET